MLTKVAPLRLDHAQDRPLEEPRVRLEHFLVGLELHFPREEPVDSLIQSRLERPAALLLAHERGRRLKTLADERVPSIVFGNYQFQVLLD